MKKCKQDRNLASDVNISGLAEVSRHDVTNQYETFAII